MSEKFIKARFQHKGKTEAEWYLDVYDGSGNIRQDPFIPLKDEIIIFEKDDAGNNENRIKVGDGETNVMDLPFAGAKYVINNKNGKTSLVNEGSGTEQEILPFFLNEAGDEVVLENKYFKIYAGEFSEPDFQSTSVWLTDGGGNYHQALYSKDFEVNKIYYYRATESGDGTITFNGNRLEVLSGRLEFYESFDTVAYTGFNEGTVYIYSKQPPTLLFGFDKDYTPNGIPIPLSHSAYLDMVSPIVTLADTDVIQEYLKESIPNTLGTSNYSLLTYDKTSKTFDTKYLQDKKVASNSFSIFDGQIGGSGAIYSISAGTSNKNALGSLKDIIGNYVSANPPKAYGSISFAGGLDSSAWSVSTVAHGIRAMAGIRGYKWTSVTETTITLNGTPTDWKENDWICIVNSSKYPFCAQIQSVSGQVVTVKGKLPFTGSNYSVLNPATNPDDKTVYAVERKANGSEESPYYTITPRGGYIELGWGAMALGADTLTSGTLSLNFGVNNVQAGDYGATFGRSNLGGYGNVVGGAWNTSIGQHSGVFGRNLVNNGDYNLMSGRLNTINNIPGSDPSSQNILGGYDNTLTGHRNMFGGQSNLFSSCFNSIGSGQGNEIVDSSNFLSFGKNTKAKSILKCLVGGWDIKINQTSGSAEESIIIGGEHVLNGTNNDSAMFGYKNTSKGSSKSLIAGTGNLAQHNEVFLLGTGLTSKAYQQVIVGRYNKDSDGMFVVGIGTSASAPADGFIVQRDGRATVGSNPRDAMDVATKNYVDSHSGGVDEEQVRTIVENVLLNGEW